MRLDCDYPWAGRKSGSRGRVADMVALRLSGCDGTVVCLTASFKVRGEPWFYGFGGFDSVVRSWNGWEVMEYSARIERQEGTFRVY